MIKPVFGDVLSQTRERKKLTQEMLATKCEVTARYIQLIEAGDRMPSVEILFLLANALDVTATDLMTPVWQQWDDAGRPPL